MTKEQEEKIHKIVENMSDEEIEDRIRQDEQGEEEAIEYIKKRIKVCNENADICDDNNFNEEATYLREESYMLETVLSMLKENSAEIEQKNTELAEKNAEIEKLKKVLDEKHIFVQGARTVYGRLMSLDKEDIVKDDLALRNEIYQHIEDKEKKDKIIGLMADYIATLDIEEDICVNVENDNCDKMSFGECEDCIKKFFERKTTNNG